MPYLSRMNGWNPRYLRIAFLLALLISLMSIWVAQEWIAVDTNDRVHHSESHIAKRRAGLVLGCARNLYFFSRIEAAAKLFHAGKVEFLIVSGDNHISTYDEAGTMKTALIERGVPEERIICDYAGFSTMDSIIRAQKVFGQESLTIISQEFHVRRALFIAKRRNIDAIGYCAEDVEVSLATRTRMREALARVKTILDLYLLNRQPVYLGKPISIGT